MALPLSLVPTSTLHGSAPGAGEGSGPRREASRLLEGLGRALHRFGTPAHRLEDALGGISRLLGIEAQFFSTPTAIFVCESTAAGTLTSLHRVEPGDVQLEKLTALDEILEKVADGTLAPGAALAAVEEVERAPARYRGWVKVAASILASGSAARFFGGSSGDVLAAGAVGLLIGLLDRLLADRPAPRRLFEALAAGSAAFTATLLAPWWGNSPSVVTVAGLIVLLPGLAVTVAMTELATRHLVSGSARLAGAAVLFVTLGFGVGLGRELGLRWTGAIPAGTPEPLPAWTELPFLLVAALAFTVLFRARPRDLGTILLGGLVAFYGGQAGAALFGPQLGAFVGAVLVGLAGNAYARLARRPSAILELPALMLLVPGSLGFQGVSSLLAHRTVSGVEAAFATFLVAAALVAGLLVSNVVLPPRRSL